MNGKLVIPLWKTIIGNKKARAYFRFSWKLPAKQPTRQACHGSVNGRSTAATSVVYRSAEANFTAVMNRPLPKPRSVAMKLYFSPGACSLSPHIVLRETGAKFDLEQVNNQE